jgi:hypothetical protein
VLSEHLRRPKAVCVLCGRGEPRGEVALTAAQARRQRLARRIVPGGPDGEGLDVRKGQVDAKFSRMRVKNKPSRGAVERGSLSFPPFGGRPNGLLAEGLKAQGHKGDRGAAALVPRKRFQAASTSL